jgi:primosomal protein N' (replication factor Y)
LAQLRVGPGRVGDPFALGLNLPDYRAMERTFQLLVQVSGRAGRGEKPGVVWVQTRDTGHVCWDFVRANDYLGFYQAELELRRKRRYPPFVKLALLRIHYTANWDGGTQVLNETSKIGREAGKERNVQFLGPAPAPLRMLRGWKRFHCLLKGADWPSIRAVYGRICERLPASDKLRLVLDLDPVDML